PYSPRARAGARVAVPLTWAELERTDPKQFAVTNFDEWKARLKHDPWLRMKDVKQHLSNLYLCSSSTPPPGGVDDEQR
ncbi:MAG: hypothetical protein ABSA94_17775, partial [Acidobacteriaceae bacterium]